MGIDSGYGIGSVKPGVCTSTTRPASPYVGQIIYETDTTLAKVWTGSAWVDTPPGKANTASPTFTGLTTAAQTRIQYTPALSGYTLALVPGGTAQGQTSNMTMYSTFQNTGDNVPRRTADIWAWFNNGAWATEALSFGVGTGGTNDVATRTTERMRIDGAGRVIMPYQPYVRAIATANATYTTGFNTIAFNSVSDNVGSHYNASTYAFTAPVAGNYLVQSQLQIRSEATNNDWAFNLGIYKNGGLHIGTYQAGIAGKSYMKHAVVGVVKMAANDSVDIKALVNQTTIFEGASDGRSTLIITFLG